MQGHCIPAKRNDMTEWPVRALQAMRCLHASGMRNLQLNPKPYNPKGGERGRGGAFTGLVCWDLEDSCCSFMQGHLYSSTGVPSDSKPAHGATRVLPGCSGSSRSLGYEFSSPDVGLSGWNRVTLVRRNGVCFESFGTAWHDYGSRSTPFIQLNST